jgi:hypothetical protein
VHGFGTVSALQVLANLFDEIRRNFIALHLQIESERLSLGRGGLLRCDLALVLHKSEHEIAAFERALRIQNWRIDRAANQTREHSRLRQSQLGDGMIEVILRGRFHAVISMGEVNLVHIHRENLLLGVGALDLNGQERLLNLALRAAIGAIQKQTAGQLHGERAGALFDTAGAQIADGRFQHAGNIHAPMFEEMLILGGGDSVLQDTRHLFIGKQNAPLQREGSDLLAVIGI